VKYAKRSEVPLYLSLTDASIFFIRPTFSKTASSPTKHAELMGMGIPVICNDIGDTGNIIDATGTGVVIREFDEAAYQEAAAKLPELAKLPKQKIRDAAFAYFDLAKGAAHYAEIYQKIINRTHHP
jgi:glycosyltransferase involved in cell wall biosynthesis